MKNDSELLVLCELAPDLPLLAEELKLLADLMPEILVAMASTPEEN